MTNERAIADSALNRFHCSLYLSLAFACACLTYAEWVFLPELTILGAVTALLLVVGYIREGRWSLSLKAANIVGAFIAVGLALWVGYQFVRPQGSMIDLLPWPISLLPYLGPLVLILIPAKLFRPKHTGDYWSLQLIGLMTVALACALAGDSILAALVLAYAFCAVWCVAEFHAVVCRGNGRADSVEVIVNYPCQTKSQEIEVARSLFRVGIWSIIAVGAAVALSLITPRTADAQWGLGSLANRVNVGYAEDRQLIDLNLTGDLQTSSEVAFEVRAETADGQPKLDISPSQRWRGSTFNYYDQGRWINRGWSSRMGYSADDRRRRGNPRDFLGQQPQGASDLPDLGPHKFYVIFPVPTRQRATCFLCEPIWPPRTWVGNYLAAPVVTETDDGRRHVWIGRAEGDAYPPPYLPGNWTKAFYRQVTAPTPEANVGPPMNVDPAFAEHLTIFTGLRLLRTYSNSLVQELIDAKAIPKYPNWSPGDQLPPTHHEEVARAFDNYLRTSGQFEYSLTLKRVDPKIDPVEDFLLNGRQGHCNRFASALALLLRSQGIPTRIVQGFEGAESNGDGTYVVRQAHAHSWVEALIRRPSPGGNPTWHWLTLDPSPVVERSSLSEGSWSRWLEDLARGLGEFFRNFVVDLNTERQDRARSTLAMMSPVFWGPSFVRFLATPLGWVTLGGIVGVVWFVRVRRQQNRLLNENYFFTQFRDLLSKSGWLTLRPGMTPNELCIQFARNLQSRDDSVAAAAQHIIRHHAEARYGGRSTTKLDLPTLKSSLKIIRSFCRRGLTPQSAPA